MRRFGKIIIKLIINKEKERKDSEEIKGLKLLEYLFRFIDENRFNPTTAGYIQKILNSLLNVRGVDVKTFI